MKKKVVDWLQQVAPQAKLKDIRAQINVMREIKSPGEIAFLNRAIELSMDAHLAAMRMMRPGLYEYQVGAKMMEVHAMGWLGGGGLRADCRRGDRIPRRCITTGFRAKSKMGMLW